MMLIGMGAGFLVGAPAGWYALSVTLAAQRARQRFHQQSRHARNWAMAGLTIVAGVAALGWVGLHGLGVL